MNRRIKMKQLKQENKRLKELSKPMMKCWSCCVPDGYHVLALQREEVFDPDRGYMINDLYIRQILARDLADSLSDVIEVDGPIDTGNILGESVVKYIGRVRVLAPDDKEEWK